MLYLGSNKDSSNSTTTQASVVSTTEHSTADVVTTTARATEESAVVTEARDEVERFEAATALPGPARLQLVTTTLPAVDEDKAAVDVGVKPAGKGKETSEGRPSVR